MPSDALNQTSPEQPEEITPEQMAEAFSASYASNFPYEVSRQKNAMRPDRQEESIKNNCSDLSPEELESLINFCREYGGTRLVIHLYRLLNNGRSNEEKAFGLAVIRNYHPIANEIKLIDQKVMEQLGEDDPVDFYQMRLSNILSSESTDSGMFWTFAPYIYKHLLAKGVTEEEVLRRICNWGLRKQYQQKDFEEIHSRHLRGLSGREEEDVQLDEMYYLTLDPNNLTHKFTDQEAKKMVDRGLFEESL